MRQELNKDNAKDKAVQLLTLLLSEEKNLNLDFHECIEKLKLFLNSYNENEIKIVLLGSFADGKTSTIAGLMEQVMDDMKIDPDESSDEIVIYRPSGLKHGFTIVDTPGLFGSKERELEGRNVQFSEITEKYISEAHIIMYVTSAVAPIKESHYEILKKVLRDYGKLNSTIFVLNKMDETGVNITDNEAYEKMCSIKKDFLITRLKSMIGLTSEESNNLKMVCVVADPKAKGIPIWLETPDRYRKLSRMPILRDSIDSLVSVSNVEELKNATALSTVKDVLFRISDVISLYNESVKLQSDKFKEHYVDLQDNFNTLKVKLQKNRVSAIEQLNLLLESTLRSIKNASFEEMDIVLSTKLGVQEDKVTFFILESEVNKILLSCSESNMNSLKFAWTDLKNKFEQEDSLFRDIADKGLDAMRNVSNKTVLAARDMFFKSFKFKPWGATKLANGIGKAAVVIQVALVAWDIYGQYKRNKQLKETIETLTVAVNNYFSEIFKTISDETSYYKMFAPSYIDMCNELEERKRQYEKINLQNENMRRFKERILDIEDAVVLDSNPIEVNSNKVACASVEKLGCQTIADKWRKK